MPLDPGLRGPFQVPRQTAARDARRFLRVVDEKIAAATDVRYAIKSYDCDGRAVFNLLEGDDCAPAQGQLTLVNLSGGFANELNPVASGAVVVPPPGTTTLDGAPGGALVVRTFSDARPSDDGTAMVVRAIVYGFPDGVETDVRIGYGVLACDEVLTDEVDADTIEAATFIDPVTGLRVRAHLFEAELPIGNVDEFGIPRGFLFVGRARNAAGEAVDTCGLFFLPSVVTGDAETLDGDAILHGKYDDGNGECSIPGQLLRSVYWYEYGATTAYGATTEVIGGPDGESAHERSATAPATIPGGADTAWHYRLVVRRVSDGSLVKGVDRLSTAVVPAVSTGAASSILAASATLNGSITTYTYHGLTWHFEYGLTTAYGSVTPSTSISASGTPQAVSVNVTGLSGLTAYHCRLVLVDAAYGRTWYGADQSFTTVTYLVDNLGRAFDVSTGALVGSDSPAAVDWNIHYSDKFSFWQGVRNGDFPSGVLTYVVSTLLIDSARGVTRDILAAIPAGDPFPATVDLTTGWGSYGGVAGPTSAFDSHHAGTTGPGITGSPAFPNPFAPPVTGTIVDLTHFGFSDATHGTTFYVRANGGTISFTNLPSPWPNTTLNLLIETDGEGDYAFSFDSAFCEAIGTLTVPRSTWGPHEKAYAVVGLNQNNPTGTFVNKFFTGTFPSGPYPNLNRSGAIQNNTDPYISSTTCAPFLVNGIVRGRGPSSDYLVSVELVATRLNSPSGIPLGEWQSRTPCLVVRDYTSLELLALDSGSDGGIVYKNILGSFTGSPASNPNPGAHAAAAGSTETFPSPYHLSAANDGTFWICPFMQGIAFHVRLNGDLTFTLLGHVSISSSYVNPSGFSPTDPTTNYYFLAIAS
jgi:hypothetical protein